MNIPEEVGKTSRDIVGALGTAPALLAVLLFNFAYIALIAWQLHLGGERWEAALRACLAR